MSKFYLSFFLFFFSDTVGKVLKILGVENQFIDNALGSLLFFAMFSMVFFIFKEKKYKKENITKKDEVFFMVAIIPVIILGLISRIIIWLG